MHSDEDSSHHDQDPSSVIFSDENLPESEQIPVDFRHYDHNDASVKQPHSAVNSAYQESDSDAVTSADQVLATYTGLADCEKSWILCAENQAVYLPNQDISHPAETATQSCDFIFDHKIYRRKILLYLGITVVVLLILSLAFYQHSDKGYDTTPTHMDLITLNPCSLAAADFTGAHLPPMHIGKYDYPLRLAPPTVTNTDTIIGHVKETSCDYEPDDAHSLMYLEVTHFVYTSGTVQTNAINKQMSDLSIQHNIGLHMRHDDVYGKEILTYTLAYAKDNFCLTLIVPNLSLQGNHASSQECDAIMQLAFNIANQSQ